MDMYEYHFGLDRIPAKFHAFRFRGGALPLHLIETVHDWEEICLDRVDDGEAWDAWLRAAGLTVPAEPISDTELESMRELRESIYLVAASIVNRRDVTNETIDSLNGFARGEVPPMVLARGETGLVSVRTSPLSHQHLLTTIAREAVALYSGPKVSRIRECADHHCPTIFLDNSQSGQKLWCSPQCSARAATRNYRARRQELQADRH